MKIAGAYTLHAGREQVWPLIQDPAHLVGLIPGCEQLEQTGPAEYRGQMQIPVAAVAGVYAIYVQLETCAEPFTTRFNGELSGPAGTIRGGAWFHLAAGGDAATSVLTYEGQGMITGPLSRMDGRIAESVARSLIGQGLANLDRRLQTLPTDRAPADDHAPATAGPDRPLPAKKATPGQLLRRLFAQIGRLLGLRTR